jgi:type I restriction-modification system DNA methylase subunit
MPTYPCEKCGRVFKQKSGYDDHMSKKTPCEETSMIAAVIDAKVEEKVKAAVRAVMPKAEITKVTDDTMKAFFEDLHNLLWNKAGLSPERALEHMTFFFAYRLIETQADALQLPQECRWSYLASHKNENDTYETMKKGCVAFQKNKVTKPFFKKPEIDKATIVYDIVQQISRISLTTMQETDTLGDIFEHMLGRGMSTMADEGQYFTNRMICKLAFKLAYDIKKTLRRADGSLCTFADWFCGTGGFPAEFVKGVNANDPSVLWARDAGALYCQDMNLSSVTTTLLNLLILTGIPFSGHTIRGGNSFTDAITVGAGAPFPGLTVDYCFMNPPYGGDKSKGKDYKFAYSKTVKGDDGKTKKFFVNQEIQSIGVEDDDKVSAGVQLAMATLSEGGVCCIVLPQGFFFGASKKCVELRKKIAEDYKIWSIVDIASGSFLNTGTKTSMMVFQKGGATETVTFMGLNETVLVEATLEELRAKNYSLNYKQYLPQSATEVDGFEMVKLGSIAKKLTTRGKHSAKDTIENGKYSLFSSSINEIYKLDTFDYTETCCIINSTNASGNAIVNLGKNFSVTSDTFVFKCENDVTTIYIQIYLSSNIHLVKETFQGANHKHPTWDRLSEIQIPLPSLDKQQEIVEQIDFYTQMAHTEEQSLKLLEKIVMGWVKEMGRGKERVKLGDVLEFQKKPGKLGSADGKDVGKYPFYTCAQKKMYVDTCEFTKTCLIVNRGGMMNVRVDKNFSVSHDDIHVLSWMDGKTTETTVLYVAYYLQANMYLLSDGMNGTTLKHLNKSFLEGFEIPLPSLAEQQTLQSDFDEIRHKHAKIAEYKAKAQEAIQRLIPGAKAANAADTAATAAESITSMSHSSTCEVDEDGYGCTCRLPLEKEDLTTTASAAATAAVAIPEVSATAAVSTSPVRRRRPTKVAIAAVVE